MSVNSFGRVAVLALALAAVSCTSNVRQGTGTSFLIIEGLEAASGASGEFGTTLQSDVLTIVDDSPTVFSDSGRVRFALGLKDPGSPSSPNSPSQNQFITVERYRVRFTRTDGRNTPGVDVPYGFDGALTATVGEGSTEAGFLLVRHVAKAEAPLGALANNFTIIDTIAEITFYGRDQTGHEVTAIGRLTVEFGNFADPDQ